MPMQTVLIKLDGPKRQIGKKSISDCRQSVGPNSDFWKHSLSLHSGTKVGGGRRGGGPREGTSATKTHADGYSQLQNSDWLIQYINIRPL